MFHQKIDQIVCLMHFRSNYLQCKQFSSQGVKQNLNGRIKSCADITLRMHYNLLVLIIKMPKWKSQLPYS